MRIVVTGATGNVGTAVIESLRRDAQVDEVIGVARRLPSPSDTAAQGDGATPVRWVSADISTDPLDMLDGADAVIHLAWQIQPIRDERRLARVNVDGTARVVAAAAQRRVERVVVASSVGTYAARDDRRPVDEAWPATGIPTSVYSRQKAAVERHLDQVEPDYREMSIVRMRTSLVFAYCAASEIARYFLGPLVPTSLIGRGLLPIVPVPQGIDFQVVHASDVAEAYRLAALGDVRGADDLARALRARHVHVGPRILRAGAAVTHALRLQPTSPGWVDLGLGVPTMDTDRARRELGWAPSRSGVETLDDLIGGFADSAGADTPPLRPGRNGACRPILDHDSHQEGPP